MNLEERLIGKEVHKFLRPANGFFIDDGVGRVSTDCVERGQLAPSCACPKPLESAPNLFILAVELIVGFAQCLKCGIGLRCCRNDHGAGFSR